MLLPSISQAGDLIFDRTKDLARLRVATPLGLGKPNLLLNEIYRRAKEQSHRGLDIMTALSLNPPRAAGASLLEERFTAPFASRHFGDDYPRLAYHDDLLAGRLPPHIAVYEFYCEAGRYLQNAHGQQHHISMNYTHVARNLAERGVDVIVQMVSPSRDGRSYSLSCNPDLTLDLRAALKARSHRCLMIGVVHPDLPYLGGSAEVGEDFFDALVISEESSHALFALPRAPIDRVDYAIGLHASTLLADGGTLQVGIGSLSDSIIWSLLLRHQDNAAYRRVIDALGGRDVAARAAHLEPFREGIYGTSEMVMDGFMHLRKAAILKRHVQDKRGDSAYLHGAFFLGSKDFYAWLSSLEGDDYRGLRMSPVSEVNDLYDADEFALRRQRVKACFYNTCMKVTLLGGAASDTLDDGRVVSGVGGQYNFVAMSQELDDAHSVLMLRSCHIKGGVRRSNIVGGHQHLTIPRHLKDIVVSEYGIAELRGQSDEETIKKILMISDAAFHDELIAEAQKAKKLSPSFRLPPAARLNTPERLKARLSAFEEGAAAALFRPFPFGSDFTPVEEEIVLALRHLKECRVRDFPSLLAKGLMISDRSWLPALDRMRLAGDKSLKGRASKLLLKAALEASQRC